METEQSVDSTNDERIVDGDLFLIKTISRYPILWDRWNFDIDQRNKVWLKLSEKLNLRVEWMKKRWSYLREQYVRHLKQVNTLKCDKPSKKVYKYFDEMSFLANHIQIRNGISSEKASTIESNDQIHGSEMEAANKDDDDDGDGNECVDFIITENEIEAYNDDDDDNMFVELSDEEEDSSAHHLDGVMH